MRHRSRSRSLWFGILPLVGFAVFASMRRKPSARSIEAAGSVTIGHPVSHVFQAFRRLEEDASVIAAPPGEGRARKIMRKIRRYGALRLIPRARVTVNADERVRWDARDGELVAHGTASFEEAPGDLGTAVHVRVHYAERSVRPLFLIGQSILRRVANVELQQELRRFKQLVETGEIATRTLHAAKERAPREPAIEAASRRQEPSVEVSP